MISDHRHRDKERFTVDRDSDGMVFDLVGARYTVTRKVFRNARRHRIERDFAQPSALPA